ncbi:MAG: glucose 1-dehydrogenase [Desulfobacteraceae bacterium]|nr:MAG: glucose 1-dehydrogenase [Desulfobacteraceae bacterium]
MGVRKSNRSEFDLDGKVAVITGAGRGMGHEIALALARYGADLVVCSRTVTELEEVASEVKKMRGRVLIQQMDIRRIPDIQAMVDASVNAYGRIDILVNNAGINLPQAAEEVTEEAWDSILNTNLKGLFFCAQAVGRVMIKQKKGKIINVSSQAGQVGIPHRAAYCSSKGAVNQLTRVLALEWAQHGINVNAIGPTFVETPFTKPMLEKAGFRDFVLDRIPWGRLGKPADVIGSVIFLASEASDLVTGHILLIDGGWTAQ